MQDETMRAAVLTAIARGEPLPLAMPLEAGTPACMCGRIGVHDCAEFAAMTERFHLGAVRKPNRRPGAVPLARKVARVATALGKLTLKRSPKWARVAAVACLAIPGPFDELVVWPVLLAYVAIRYRAEFAATARSAWDGAA